MSSLSRAAQSARIAMKMRCHSGSVTTEPIGKFCPRITKKGRALLWAPYDIRGEQEFRAGLFALRREGPLLLDVIGDRRSKGTRTASVGHRSFHLAARGDRPDRF